MFKTEEILNNATGNSDLNAVRVVGVDEWSFPRAVAPCPSYFGHACFQVTRIFKNAKFERVSGSNMTVRMKGLSEREQTRPSRLWALMMITRCRAKWSHQADSVDACNITSRLAHTGW